MRSVGWTLLALAGCGRIGFGPTGGGGDDVLDDALIDAPPPPYEAPWTSGSRIKAFVMRAVDGGDPIRYAWYDSLLDTNCASRVDVNDVERCLPTNVQILSRFADAGCTQPVVTRRTTTCEIDKYAFDLDTMGRFRIYTIGPAHTAAIYSNQTGPCVLDGIGPDEVALTVGAEVPPATFVNAGYDNRIVGAYIRADSTTADGARSYFGAITLPASGRTCYPTGGRLGPTACSEANYFATEVYQDIACTQRGYLWERQPYHPAALTTFVVEAPMMCGSSPQSYQVIADVTATTYYEQTLTGCAARSTPLGALIYTATPISDPFPTGSVSIGPRRGRLGKLYWTASDGIAAEVGDWDHELQTTCRPFLASDGKLRCLPRQPQRTAAAVDATCGGALSSLATECFATAPYHGPDYTTCADGPWAVRSLATLGTAASLVRDGACHVLDVRGGVYGGPTGVELPPGMFPELVVSVE